ncbi:efflux RND transporter periplasmic adaptor subunit [Dyella soli]|uniref:efflux RND transporter periplasmic adaptor subunit n=1 Tax=Dyella soli TaxID=522319 RepID=UPI001F0ED23D|nr:efflux RND transporter periplasmic adaptor subunit [Dyella soli]
MTRRKSPRSAGLLPRSLWLLATVAALATVSGCARHEPEIEPGRAVIAMPVKAVDGAPTSQFPGEIHARYEMPLSFRVGGQLTARYARLGDTVKKGQPLAQLDDADARKTQASAQASLDAAEHRLIFATQQRDRDEAQAKQNLISQLQLDQTRDAYASAVAGRDQAKQQLALTQNQSNYTTLVADRDGSITSEQAEAGQVVAAGQPVFGFAWSGDRDVFIDVPEDRVAGMLVGQAAKVTVQALPGASFAGHVRDISPAADPQARTYRVKLAVDVPSPQLRLGMTAEVSLSTASDEALAVRIPATALFHQGDRPAVWVVRPSDSKLELRAVTVSRYGEHDVLVGNGLHAGERVVMQGVHAVSADEKVTPIAPPHAEDVPL